MKRMSQTARNTNGYMAVMVGFGLYWAWIDCCFFAPFLYHPSTSSVVSLPILHLSVIACSLVLSMYVVAINSTIKLLGTPVVSLWAISGIVGGVLLLIGSFTGVPLILGVAVLCGGLSMGLGALAWGVHVASFGVAGASVCIPGTFIVAVAVGLLVQALPPEIASVVVVLLPLGSAVLLVASLRKSDDGAHSISSASVSKLASLRERRSDGRMWFAVERCRCLRELVPLHFLVILFLFCMAFGVMQYLLVLPHVDSSTITMQNIAVRGFIALVVLIGFGLLSWRPDSAYKIGLLLITAGFLATPFLKSVTLSSSIIMAGYTCFDMMGWIIVSSLVVKHEENSFGIIALFRLFEMGGVLCGGVLGLLARQWVWSDDANMAIATTVIAYLLVAAAVLLLYRRTTSVWSLMERIDVDASPVQASEEAIEKLVCRCSLTPREQDVLTFFVAGRSIPWIAEHEGISEGTVRSHTRHLYEKVNVHSRQELLDVVECEVDTQRE